VDNVFRGQLRSKELRMNYWVIAVIAGLGAVGGFMNVFIGDAGFHLPKTEDDVWQPGFLGVVVVGCIAAIGSWAIATASPMNALRAAMNMR
jgi:predicted lysophospholipase L1 biosynthesis ABC-type transport system permease subunit